MSSIVRIKPRSLHSVTRRAKTAREKKPGHFGRDDRKNKRAMRKHKLGLADSIEARTALAQAKAYATRPAGATIPRDA